MKAALMLVVAALSLLGAACDKPSEDDCQAAVARIRKLHGNENDDVSIEKAAVRSCQGSASKDSVKCIINAQDIKALQACEGGLYEKMYGDEPIETPGDKTKK